LLASEEIESEIKKAIVRKKTFRCNPCRDFQICSKKIARLRHAPKVIKNNLGRLNGSNNEGMTTIVTNRTA
jgi:hypothetical protein